MKIQFEDLKNGVVLAELGGHGDGPYCAKYASGAALALMGTYIIDSSDNVPYPADFVFKPGISNYSQYLEQHILEARKSGAKVGVSACSVELKDTVDFFIACEEAGADYVSLCAYSSMEMFTSKGLGCELVHKENRSKLREWTDEILKALTIPYIFKFGLIDEPDAVETVDILSDMGVPLIHAVGDSKFGSQGLANLSNLADRCQFLIGAGGVTDIKSAKNILSVGAGAVAVATAAMKYPTFLDNLQLELKRQDN